MQLKSFILILCLLSSVAFGQISVTNIVENPKTVLWTVKAQTFAVNSTTNKVPCWRVLHDGVALIYVPWFDSGSKTETRQNIAECKTLEDVKKYIIDKKLKVTPEQQAEIDALKEEDPKVVEVTK